MQIVGFLLNYKDEKSRQSVPTGVLAVYEITKEPVAVSESPFSAVLMNSFRNGVAFSERGALGGFEERRATNKDLQKFYEVAKAWFDRGGYRLEKVALPTPLIECLYLNGNMGICAKEAAAETVLLKGVKP